MSSSVCQGLQSCLEPWIVEPRVLIHRLATQKRNLEGWSFIQELTNTSHYKKQGNETEQLYVYVHPLVKTSSSSTLSTKSLEMCTESLGSETGNDISESIDEFASMVMEKPAKSREFTKKVNRSVNFPPPLSSISGSDGVQFRPHREDGRLVLKAVTTSSCNSSFQAERVNGRLKLSFLKDSTLNLDKENIRSEDNNGDDDDFEDDENGGSWEFQRMMSRRKEGENGNKGMSNWGTFCIAIS